MAVNLYEAHAEIIESALAHIRRAQRLTADAGDEFSSWARMRLLENDCAILRKFEGRSTLRTFLLTVLQRLFLDWRIQEWGKWRPTTAARRLGPVAIELERLVLRDRLEYAEAVATLVSRGTAISIAECDEVWGQLPRRPTRGPAVDVAIEELVPVPMHDPVAVDGRRVRAAIAGEALASAIPTLAPQDQLIVKLRFQDGFTVARIAQLLGEDQRQLYRRIERLLLHLRTSLIGAGVSAEDVRELMGDPEIELQPAFGRLTVSNPGHGPSRSSNAGGEA